VSPAALAYCASATPRRTSIRRRANQAGRAGRRAFPTGAIDWRAMRTISRLTLFPGCRVDVAGCGGGVGHSSPSGAQRGPGAGPFRASPLACWTQNYVACLFYGLTFKRVRDPSPSGICRSAFD